jgi:kexin
MMNVTPVWDMGYTGKGVITALIDDGLDSESDDLKDNFVCVPPPLPLP